jgi:hypothetical protein
MLTQALLIDPHNRQLRTVELPDNQEDWRAVARWLKCDYTEEVRLRSYRDYQSPGIVLFVDEEGMMKPHQRFWCFKAEPERIYAGKGLISAVDANGNLISGVAEPEAVQPHVRWLNVRFLGFEDHQSVMEHPILGRVPVIHRKPKFEEVQ